MNCEALEGRDCWMPYPFYDLFHYLECQNALDPDNDRHLWCLHYVFIPIINRQLEKCLVWVHHPLHTDKNMSPMQLWIRGLQAAWGSQTTMEDEVFGYFLNNITFLVGNRYINVYLVFILVLR